MRLVFVIIAVFCSLNVIANEIKAKVMLSPTGSFEAKTTKVLGNLSFVNDSLSSERLSIPKKSLKTGIELRDQHLKEKIKGKYITLSSVKGSNGVGFGVLEFNGVKKKIKFNYKRVEKQTVFDFKLNLPDFNVKGIRYMGIGVKDKVSITGSIN